MVRTWPGDDWRADSLRTVHERRAVRPRGVLHAARRGERGSTRRLLDLSGSRTAVRGRPRSSVRSGVGAARSTRLVHHRRRRCRAWNPRSGSTGRRTAVCVSDALRGGRDLRRPAGPPSRPGRVSTDAARRALRRCDRRQRTARQPPLQVGRVRRRLARSVRRGRPIRQRGRTALRTLRPCATGAAADAPTTVPELRSSNRRPGGSTRPAAGSHAARYWSSTTASLGPASWPPDRGGSGSVRFGETSAATITCTPPGHRTSRSTSRSINCRNRTRCGARRSTSSSWASRSSWMQAGDSGRNMPPGPDSRRCGCGAGSANRKHSWTRRASAGSSSPNGVSEPGIDARGVDGARCEWWRWVHSVRVVCLP